MVSVTALGAAGAAHHLLTTEPAAAPLSEPTVQVWSPPQVSAHADHVDPTRQDAAKGKLTLLAGVAGALLAAALVFPRAARKTARAAVSAARFSAAAAVAAGRATVSAARAAGRITKLGITGGLALAGISLLGFAAVQNTLGLAGALGVVCILAAVAAGVADLRARRGARIPAGDPAVPGPAVPNGV